MRPSRDRLRPAGSCVPCCCDSSEVRAATVIVRRCRESGWAAPHDRSVLALGCRRCCRCRLLCRGLVHLFLHVMLPGVVPGSLFLFCFRGRRFTFLGGLTPGG